MSEIPNDAIAVNLMRFAGLDKHKARECEAIVRKVLAGQEADRAHVEDLRRNAADTSERAAKEPSNWLLQAAARNQTEASEEAAKCFDEADAAMYAAIEGHKAFSRDGAHRVFANMERRELDGVTVTKPFAKCLNENRDGGDVCCNQTDTCSQQGDYCKFKRP